jgi:hypothetical protein
MQNALLIDGARPPRGRGKATGALHDVHPRSGSRRFSIRTLEQRTGLTTADVEDGSQDLVVDGGVESTSRWLPAFAPLGAGNERLRVRNRWFINASP